MGRKSTRTETGLSDGQREHLERVAGHPRSLRKHAWRARIVPGLGSGHGLMETIRRTGMSKPTLWRASPFSNPPSTSPNLDKTEPDGRRPDIAHARLKPKNHPMRTNRLAKRLKIP